MNHKAIVEHECELIYNHRRYILHHIDDHYFEALNWNGHIDSLNGGSLDALDYLPQGCMLANDPQHYRINRDGAVAGRQGQIERGVLWEDELARRATTNEIISEVLAQCMSSPG